MSTHSQMQMYRPAVDAKPAVRLTSRTITHVSDWLNRNSIEILRVSLGMIFLLFGALKFVPGASPAEELVMRTLDTLSMGLVPGRAAVVITAMTECFIGITLMSGRLLRSGLCVLAISLVGIMSPLVLFYSDLFPGAPTIEGQYVLKDIVLAAAGLVIAARALGGRLVSDDHSGAERP